MKKTLVFFLVICALFVTAVQSFAELPPLSDNSKLSVPSYSSPSKPSTPVRKAVKVGASAEVDVLTADLVFFIDTSGSMGPYISKVKNNLKNFSDQLVARGIDVNFAVVEFSDIFVYGEENSTKIFTMSDGGVWTSDVDELKDTLDSLSSYYGGDEPETPTDAMKKFYDAAEFRNGASRFAFLLTDAYPKGRKDDSRAIPDDKKLPDMSEITELFKKADMTIHTVVISRAAYDEDDNPYYKAYGYVFRELYEGTGGEFIDINSDDYSIVMTRIVEWIEKEAKKDLKIENNLSDSGKVGEAYSGTVTVSGGTSPYDWDYEGDLPDGLSLKPNSDGSVLTISGTPTAEGDFDFELTVTDSAGTSKTIACYIFIDEDDIDPLEIDSDLSYTGNVGEAYKETASVTGGVGPYTWEYEGTLPKGLKIKQNKSGTLLTLYGTPKKAGTFTFDIIVTDSQGESESEAVEIVIYNIEEDVEDLEIQADFEDTAIQGEYYEGRATVTGGVAPYEWDYDPEHGDLPEGLELTEVNNGLGLVISGNITEAGKFTFVIQVTDARGETAEEVINLTVEGDPDLPPEISETDFEPTTYVGKFYSGIAKVENGQAPYTWSVDGDLPPGLQLADPEDDDWTEAEITGKPTKKGTYSFKLVVTDDKGESDEVEVEITVKGLSLSGKFTQTALINKSYSSYVTVKDGEAPYTVKKSSGTLPTGLKLSVSGAKVYLKGTAKTAGKFTFKIKVTDGNKATVSKSYTVTITQPEITGTFKAGKVGKTYSGSATVTGGTSPYTWKASGIPAGLEFSQNAKGTKATLKGKPTKAKVYTLKLTATDKNKVKVTKSFTIQIKKKSSTSKTETSKAVEIPTGFNPPVNGEGQGVVTQATPLEVFEEDVVSKGEGKDEDLVEVKADQPVRFVIGEWASKVEAEDVEVFVDDKAVDAEVSEDGKFTIPAELVHDDFKVQAKAGGLETIELFISAVK